jgi:cholesterol oxidase
MSDHFEAVVVGSGFGGSVMTCRLAEAGLRVCLLERGRSYPANSFPRAPYKMSKNFWDPSEGLYGMFNIWSFQGAGSVVASGLGGGSLIYANVLIRKDEKWFVREDTCGPGYECWPVTRKDLEPHYDQVERMMNAQPYPLAETPYNKTWKTLAMREMAKGLSLEWLLPNLAVSFRPKPYDPQNPNDPGNQAALGEPILEPPGRGNLHGCPRQTCRLCGECDIGCNFGSKNTLDYNYLSEAQRLGAEIRTWCEVRSFDRRDQGGYVVRYVVHEPEHDEKQDTRQLRVQQITCDRLILAAGTFGSTYLLLKNRSGFPKISHRLGSQFSTNGDLLAFYLKSQEYKDKKMVPRILDPSYGPVITSAIRVGDALDGAGVQGRGFYIEDGGYPEFLNWVIESLASVPGAVERTLHLIKRFLRGHLGWDADTDLGSEISKFLGDFSLSKSSFPVLVMGRDTPSGRMYLQGKYLDCDWNIEASRPYYERMRHILHRLAESLQAEFMENLNYILFQQIITAHPLGGCPMGGHKEEGVVDAYGEVFDYPGLYIADGSVMPGPVGPNPSLTIAALANRFADNIIAQKRG